MNDSAPGNPSQRSVNWPMVIVIASLLAIPVSYAVYARLSGENHFGQGLEHSWYPAAFCGNQALAFLGLTLAPCMRVQSDRRQGLLMVLAVPTFLICEALCFSFFAFNSFPD